MKKALLIILVLILALCLASCGGKRVAGSDIDESIAGGDDIVKNVSGAGNDNAGSAAAPSGDEYNSGTISVIVPEGWMAFPYYGMGSGDIDPDVISVNKGAKSEFDIQITPGLQITRNYHGSAANRDLYEETTDVGPLKLGNYTWQGFSGESYGYSFVILWTDGDDSFQVTVWTDMGGETISFDDGDVQGIIACISPA